MFQFPRFPPRPYGFRTGCGGITPRALPHSGIPGSTPADGSPRLIAAYHALRRLLAPRHPPYALASAAPAPSRARHTPDLAQLLTGYALVQVRDPALGLASPLVGPRGPSMLPSRGQAGLPAVRVLSLRCGAGGPGTQKPAARPRGRRLGSGCSRLGSPISPWVLHARSCPLLGGSCPALDQYIQWRGASSRGAAALSERRVKGNGVEQP